MADDYTSTISTTGTVAVDGSKRGNIETNNDADWFQVVLVAGQTYQIDVKGSPTGDGTLDDPLLLGIRDSVGRYIVNTGNDDGGTGYNSQITYTALADGSHFVAVGAYEDDTGTYRVSVTDVTDTGTFTDDHPATTATTGTVAVGGSVTGDIETPGDLDWFAVDLTAGTTYQIDLKGSTTGDGTLWDPDLIGVHSATGSIIFGTAASGGGDGLNSRVEFTPTSTGTHYVSAGGISSNTGTYTLSVSVKEEVPIVDDHSATRQTTGAVDVDGSVTGEIETGNDRDWFAVVLEANTTYQIDLKGSRTGDGTLSDPYLRGVYNAAGNFIGGTTNDNGGRGVNSRVTFTATSTGTHYVAAGGRGSSETGTYTLSVMDLTDEHSATRGTTGRVDVDSSVTGEIDYRGDRDWFRVSLEEGKNYEIYLEGSPTRDGTLRDPYLRGVYDRNGNRIAGTTDDDGGVDLNSEVEFTAQYSGDHYVAAGGYGGSKGTYRLSVLKVADSVPYDFGAETGASGVDVGGSATGEINSRNDRDWFAVAFEADTTYRIDLKGSRTGDGTLTDPFLRGVYNENGDLIAGTRNNNGGTGRNSRVEFTADDAGTYYVEAGATGGGRGTYTLTVVEFADTWPNDDFAAGTGTTGAVAVGGSTTGEIETRFDRDWFAVELEANTTYQIDLEGAGTWAGTLIDPFLRGIHNSDGNPISRTTNDDAGMSWNSQVDFTATQEGTYYVAAGAYGGFTGTYTLTVVEDSM